MIETGAPSPDSGPSSAQSHEALGRKMAKGAVWMVVARLSDRVLGLASTVVLARLLLPADFGLVAMATSVIAMVEVVGTFGFDVALIQNPAAARRHYDTAWTFQIIVGCATAAILLLLAVPAAHLYGEPRVQAVLMTLAIGPFVTGFENIGVVAFRKELRFSQEFKFLTAKRLVTFGLTIPLAFALRNYWALVIGTVVGRVLAVSMSYWLQSYRPRLSLEARAELFHFSKWLALGAILNFLGTRASDFLIGRFAGARGLGLFSLSNEIANLPTSDLIAPINRAIFPGYAKLATDTPALQAGYLATIGFILTLGIPAGVGIAAVSPLLVPLALGSNWLDATPLLSILSFYGLLLLLGSNNHYVYLAMGRPRIAIGLGFVHIAITLPIVAYASYAGGAYGAAVGFLVAQALYTPLTIWTIMRYLQLGAAQLLGVFFRPVVAASVMFGAVRLVRGALGTGSINAHELIGPTVACVLTGAVVYASALCILWLLAGKPDGPERRILELASARLQRLRRRFARSAS